MGVCAASVSLVLLRGSLRAQKTPDRGQNPGRKNPDPRSSPGRASTGTPSFTTAPIYKKCLPRSRRRRHVMAFESKWLQVARTKVYPVLLFLAVWRGDIVSAFFLVATTRAKAPVCSACGDSVPPGGKMGLPSGQNWPCASAATDDSESLADGESAQ